MLVYPNGKFAGAIVSIWIPSPYIKEAGSDRPAEMVKTTSPFPRVFGVQWLSLSGCSIVCPD